MNKYEKAKFVTIITIIGNILLTTIKFVVGLLGNSRALFVDGFETLSDVVTSVVVLYGLNSASKPVDIEHPYGHGKAESLAARTVAGLLILTAGWLCWSSIRVVTHHEIIRQPEKITLWVALFSVLVKEGMFQYKFRLGMKLNSSSLVADAWHHRSDALAAVIASIGIAISIVGGTKWHFFDHLAAVIIALMVMQVGVRIFRKTTSELMDEMPSSEIINK
ncbi:MAG: cation diffusion facilitator family transporter, partial [Elusimicrobiota bacterium]|nr:cation diffusion facilitator family transporter [Elusimicrobiota bacterium]